MNTNTSLSNEEITKISKLFAKPFRDTIGGINGSGWLIVDPLSAYLNTLGYTNSLSQMPANDKHPLVLIMEFEDGRKFIPAGGDLKSVHPEFKNWMWI